MNWMEFTANIIDNVFSWPVAVLLVVFLLRRQLRELFRTVENFVLEAGGTKVSVTRSLERAREGVDAAREGIDADKADILPSPTESDASGNHFDEQGNLNTSSPNKDAVPTEGDYLTTQFLHTAELSQTNPSYAIDFAWHHFIVEQARRLAHARDLPPDPDTMYLLTTLNSHGVVPDALVDSVRNLGKVRLEVGTTERELSPNEALEYTRIAYQVGRHLNYLRRDTAKKSQPPHQ